MSTESSTARLRSATEFPKALEQLNPAEANQLYVELRDCLIFTNRSRSQLIRRNEEHKQSVLSLRGDMMRLQSLISQLNLEKQDLLNDRQTVVTDLGHELNVMTSHLEQLAIAFEDVKDVNGAMGAMAIPGKFAKFWQALKALIVWWHDEHGDEPSATNSLTPKPTQPELESDRRDRPQMHTDPASIQRAERD